MKTSSYFSQLKASYQSEIDDLRFDSAGNDVLNVRLEEKKRAFKDLLPMMGIAPEMVAATFHGGISFIDPALMQTFVLQSPGTLDAWAVVSENLIIPADQDPLVQLALGSDGGDEFLVTMACLQFLFDVEDETFDADVDQEEDAFDDEDDEYEGADKSEDWLSEQGFDRRTPT
jgi:hypothetical protein